jgi:hypothetical protein
LGYPEVMYTGISLFLIALGAILAYAVTARVAGIEIETAGYILMVIGVVGLIVSLFQTMAWRDRRAPRDRVVEREY